MTRSCEQCAYMAMGDGKTLCLKQGRIAEACCIERAVGACGPTGRFWMPARQLLSPQRGALVGEFGIGPDPNPYGCAACKRRFRTERAVIDHARDKHGVAPC